MFSTFKKKALKKAVTKTTLKGLASDFDFKMKTVGIVIEKNEIAKIDGIIQALRQKGAATEQVDVLVYTGLTQSKQVLDPSFCMSDFTLAGETQSKVIQDFVAKSFDLLINFYAEESAPLMWVSAASKAKFKVGVATVTPRINHFSLDIHELQASQYVEHLMNYITIFKTK